MILLRPPRKTDRYDAFTCNGLIHLIWECLCRYVGPRETVDTAALVGVEHLLRQAGLEISCFPGDLDSSGNRSNS
jgi:hypothetical protein